MASQQSTPSLSITQRRWRKFKSMKRGYYSLVLLVTAYLVSFALPLLIGSKPIFVQYDGNWYSPAFREFLAELPLVGSIAPPSFEPGTKFGLTGPGSESEPNYRELKTEWERQGSDNMIVMPFYPFSPNEDVTVTGNKKFVAPFEEDDSGHVRILGTDNNGRDVLARMTYGFRVSLSFALLIAIIEFLIGIPIGAVMGYFGGWIDILLQRFMEIWHALPFLFVIMIVVSMINPTFFLLVFLIVIFGWLGMASQMRAQYYRERSRDYVAAAVSIGVPTRTILVKHILPNTLIPIITFFPFAVVSGISALVSLDFLGFGLPPPTPSWGQMIGVGLQNLSEYWLVVVPFSALFLTLTLVVFIGEGIREAFDPKVFSRLR
ncbi:MAG: ABC transporter permease subunit [Candidatus Kapabacteria bacterium]|nr:ABC transporter permease subunit [Candidatus Kapabacteria bacterium]